jgi:glyoxylase-like metal-dependent hydrolase (beta-lactamase superfamily II)
VANFDLLRDGALSTLVDAGYPRYFKQLTSALAALGSSLEAVSGAIVTHHHVDRVGTAEAARSRSEGRAFVYDHPVAALERPSDDQTLDPAGRPRVVHVPGHTAVLADRGVLITGDALVNVDYATGSADYGSTASTRTARVRSPRLTGWQPSTPTRSCSVTAIPGATASGEHPTSQAQPTITQSASR